MTKARTIPALAVLAAGTLLLAVEPGHAQSSLGIGTNEAMLPQTGLFGGLVNWVNTQQQAFYRALTGALKRCSSATLMVSVSASKRFSAKASKRAWWSAAGMSPKVMKMALLGW